MKTKCLIAMCSVPANHMGLCRQHIQPWHTALYSGCSMTWERALEEGAPDFLCRSHNIIDLSSRTLFHMFQKSKNEEKTIVKE